MVATQVPVSSFAKPVEGARPRVRQPHFGFDEQTDPQWNNRNPDFAIIANALSMLMPHLEPYVVRSVRGSFAELGQDPVYEAPDGLLDHARDFVRQEAQHHVEHRRFNDVLARRYGLTRIESWMSKTFSWLERRKSPNFGLGFAAGSETVAFTVAQWVDRRIDRVVDVEDPTAALFLWHLAEEAEHRSIAFDVHRAAGGTRRQYTKGLLASFVVMIWFIFLGTVRMMWRDRRIFNPFAWFNILFWFFSFMFHAIPLMAVTTMNGHHPMDLAEPMNLQYWLQTYDDRYFTPSTPKRARTTPKPITRTFEPTKRESIGIDHLGGAEICNDFLRRSAAATPFVSVE